MLRLLLLFASALVVSGRAEGADDGENLQFREQAIIALGEARGVDCIPELTHIALDNPHPQLRRDAPFWPAQHDDPAVLDLFERILLD
jgi:hypothetical protein